MNKYLIRFNKSKGQSGRGTDDHAWRVFENGKEYLFKHLDIRVPVSDERSGPDFNIMCYGELIIDYDTSTALIIKDNQNITNTFYYEMLPNLGYAQSKLPENIFISLKEEINLIKNNSREYISFNERLVGNIEREYKIFNSLSILDPFIRDMAHFFIDRTPSFKEKKFTKITPEATWVNLMKKGEFNPLHNHIPEDGLSYVVWIKIPYSPKEEKNLPMAKNSPYPVVSDFDFVYTNSLGKLNNLSLSPDESWEGTIIMFPAGLNHQVHPFYTSDDYRISVAGNIALS